jgi:diaminohydroxyphosphoribosylaminopyrimidine deaminase/5-amino-6-(5-phosphoribosylamino)uracil reductase
MVMAGTGAHSAVHRFGALVTQAGRSGAASPDADRHWLLEAISLSRCCPPSATAFSVGAVLVGADGTVLSTGYSRECTPADHAEEVALARIGLPGAAPLGSAGTRNGLDLAGATMYSSLEPCASRASRPTPCADLIIASGIGRVVIAWREPPIFVSGGGAVRLRQAGLAVIVVPELAGSARAVNAHLLGG